MQKLLNPTNKDLSFGWDSVGYTIPAGGELYLPDFVAKHGAKKLTDRECKDVLDLEGRAKMQASFLGDVKQPEPEPEKPTFEQEVKVKQEKIAKEEFKELDKLKVEKKPKKKKKSK